MSLLIKFLIISVTSCLKFDYSETEQFLIFLRTPWKPLKVPCGPWTPLWVIFLSSNSESAGNAVWPAWIKVVSHKKFNCRHHSRFCLFSPPLLNVPRSRLSFLIVLKMTKYVFLIWPWLTPCGAEVVNVQCDYWRWEVEHFDSLLIWMELG